MAKIIFFSPHSFVWVHAFPEAIVAESLMKSGHEIVYITCGESLNTACICLSLAGVQPGSKSPLQVKTCHRCTLSANLIRKEFKLPGYSLASVEEPGDEEKVNSIMAGLRLANFPEFVLENVPIGRIAAYEFLVRNKKMNVDFSESEWQQYYHVLKNAIKIFYLLKRIFAKENPDCSISYNSFYSINAVCSYLSREKGIAEYFMHAGSNFSKRLSTLYIGRGTPGDYVRAQIKYWSNIKSLACSKELLADVTEHFLELLRGRSIFVYSAPKSTSNIDVRNHFKIRKDQKILIATLSSNDEVFAGEFVEEDVKSEKLFKTQVDWIKALVKWIKNKPEYFLIIRVHPREFPNKRDSLISENAVILQKLFVDFPDNVCVNWPKDGLSIYDLACEADVFLNSWSSVGVEMSLLGVPVVIYIKEGLHYPVDLNYLGETEEHYFAQIEQALKDGWNFERIRKTYRWLSQQYGRSLVWIGDSYTGSVEPRAYKYWIQRKVVYHFRKLFPLLLEQKDCRKRSTHLKNTKTLDKIFSKCLGTSFDAVNAQIGPAPTFDQETVYIKQEMIRISKALWGETDNMQDGHKGKLFLQFKDYLTS